MSTSDLDTLKHAAAAKAVEFVKDGMVLGLGTGSTAKHLIMALGEKVKAGMNLMRRLNVTGNCDARPTVRDRPD